MFSTPSAGYRLLFTEQPGRTPSSGVISRLVEINPGRIAVVASGQQMRTRPRARASAADPFQRFANRRRPMAGRRRAGFLRCRSAACLPAMNPGSPVLGNPFPWTTSRVRGESDFARQGFAVAAAIEARGSDHDVERRAVPQSGTACPLPYAFARGEVQREHAAIAGLVLAALRVGQFGAEHLVAAHGKAQRGDASSSTRHSSLPVWRSTHSRCGPLLPTR